MVRQIASVAIVICFLTSLRAEPPKKAVINPNRPALVVPVSAAEKAGRTSSLKLVQDQSVIQCLEIIRQSIELKEYLGVLPLIDQVLVGPNSFVPTSSATEVSAHEEVWRLLKQMPVEIRQRFEEQRRVSAKNAWEQARTAGITEVEGFLSRFADTKLATDAWWWIGCYERDHDRDIHAAAAFLKVAKHPNSTERQRVMALMACVESHQSGKFLPEFVAARGQLSRMDANLPVVVAGRSHRLGEWLTEHPNGDTAADDKQTQRRLSVDEWRRNRPVLLPEWKQEFNVPQRANLDALEQKQRDQGVRPTPMIRSMVIGQRVMVRTLDEIKAFDLNTGTPQWEIANAEFQQIGKRGFENNTFQTAVTDWAQRRAQADSIFGRMSADGSRLFAIQEPDRSGEVRIERESPRSRLRTGPRFNKLCCYSVKTGQLDWEVGEAPVEIGGTFTGCFFLGCPFVLDCQLYVVAQRETELELLVLEPERGTVVWSIAIGTAPLPIEEDLQRSRIACPIVWSNGLLLCSTSAGVIVAIDPLLRTLVWGYRYPAMTVSASDLVRVPGQAGSSISHEAWWESWREPFAEVVDLPEKDPRFNQRMQAADLVGTSIFVFASPESEELHAIQLPDGKPLWKVPRNGGLFVAGIAEDTVVVIEGDAVRAHDLNTGHLRWRSVTTEVGGPAAIIGSVLFVPDRYGGTSLLAANDGSLLSESSSSEPPLGALTESERGWIAASRQAVMLLPRLEDVRRNVDQELERDPNNESFRVRAALLDLQAGEIESARKRLEGLTSSPARDLRRQALIAALANTEADRSGVDRKDLARQLTQLADNADYKFVAAAAIGASALSVGDFVATVEASLEGLSAELDPYGSMIKTSSTAVRKDRVLLGLIEEAYRRSKPNEHEGLDELFLSRLKLARKSRDRFAVQQLANRWRGFDWSRRLSVSDEEKAFRKSSFVEVELRLLDASGANDSTVALEAFERLARRFDHLGLTRDAQTVRQRILLELPSATFPDGQTESERIANDPSILNSISNAPNEIWPETSPEINAKNERNFGVYCPLVPMHAEPGSLAERIDVAVDRTGNEVVFRGESFFQSGQDEDHERKLDLPKSASQFRGPSGFMLREAWGVGRIVVLLVGSDLFAITPLDEQGEPNSKFLWANPIDLQLPFGETKVQDGPSWVHDKLHTVTDLANRPLGKVGPVRPTYLCFQKGTMLVAVETETGRELWHRRDIPFNATILGDDHYVFVWIDRDKLEILSAIDGRKLEDGVGVSSPDSLIHHRGSLVWTATRGENIRLELHDLRNGQSVWARIEPADSLIAVLDPETLAVVTRKGELNLLAARTGIPICEPLAVNADSMTGIVAWHDPERWYLALTTEIGVTPANKLASKQSDSKLLPTNNANARLSALKAPQPNGAYRLKFLNGPLYAVNRHHPKILWKRDLQNEPFGLDQSRAAPVLVQIWKLLPKGNNAASEGMLRVIDKRTGKTLMERRNVDVLPYFLLNPDPQQAILELKLTQETLRMNYAPDRPADAVDDENRTKTDRVPD